MIDRAFLDYWSFIVFWNAFVRSFCLACWSWITVVGLMLLINSSHQFVVCVSWCCLTTRTNASRCIVAVFRFSAREYVCKMNDGRRNSNVIAWSIANALTIVEVSEVTVPSELLLCYCWLFATEWCSWFKCWAFVCDSEVVKAYPNLVQNWLRTRGDQF